MTAARLAARGWFPALTCAGGGVALSLSFPEPSLSPLAWGAIVPLLLAASGARPRRGFVLGCAFGLGFFGVLLIWISAVGWVAWVLLVALQVAFVGGFGASWAWLSRAPRPWWIVTAPAAWVTFEQLRESVPVVGFPWGQLAQGQVGVPWLLPVAGAGGGKGVSFLVVVVNVLVVLAWRQRGRTRAVAAAGALAIVAAVPVAGAVVGDRDAGDPARGGGVRVAIVQGNARAGVYRQDERARVERHVELTRDLAGRGIDLVVWPESAVGIDPERDLGIAQLVAEAALAVDAPMIVGANLDTDDGRYLVVTLLISPEGAIVERYQKTHLVPFGEYVPARSALGWIPLLDQVPRDAVAGSEPVNFEVAGTEVATAISFEGDFGPLVRERVAAGARVVVVATNTSTWGRTWASAQHVAMSQVRAAENGVPVVHAALSGISAAVEADGRIAARTRLYETDTLIYTLHPATSITLYALTGEWLPLSCVAIWLVALAYEAARRRRRP